MLCDDVQKLIHPYVDGEFSDDELGSFENHLAVCPRCRDLASYQTVFKASLKRRLRESPAPEEVRSRLTAALAQAPTPLMGWQRTAFRWAHIAAAAMLLLMLGVSIKRRSNVAAVADLSVDRHQRELPIEIASPDPASVRTWFRGKVGFPVRAPQFTGLASHAIGSAPRLVGARLSSVHDRDAAYLVYDWGGEKISVIVFDPNSVGLGEITDEPNHPAIRLSDGRAVYMGERGPYRVALYRDHGVAYAITGDVDQQTMIRLVSASLP